MKQILIELDTNRHPSPFDAIAAYDAGVDIVLGFGAITPDNLAGVVQGTLLPRGPDGLQQHGVLGRRLQGARGRDGVQGGAQAVLRDRLNLSIMLDSDGSNTTAAGGLRRGARGRSAWRASRAAAIGVGPVGLRTAELLRREGAEVSVLTFPPDVFEGFVPASLGGLPSPRTPGST